MELAERFMNYCRIDTQSDPNSGTTPSSDKQFNLANLLVRELKQLGVSDAKVNEYCVVYGHIKANYETDKKIGFIAHMDTSDQMSGENCKPRVLENFSGNAANLNKDLNIILNVEVFPDLAKTKGKTIIVTDGTTLLGGDDKAGIAEIMDLVQYIHEHPEFKHCGISVAFTPDEEIGEGAKYFDIEEFDADYAYTIDGEEANNVEYENFNAASAIVKIKGLSIHPGSAKDKMINASLVAIEFNSLLPEKDRPENTEGYEGFNHLTDIEGEVENCKLEYIIRNHDRELLDKQKEDFYKAEKIINKKYGTGTCAVEIFDTYKNMRELIEPHIEIVENVKKIINDLGLEAASKPIRGGTDGAILTYKGLLCPNIGTGTRNCHGKYEYVIVEEMKIIVEVLKRLVAVN